MIQRLMVSIPAKTDTHYPIFLGEGLLEKLECHLPNPMNFESLVIITDHRVKKLYGHSLAQQLHQHFPLKKISLLSFPSGEHGKNQATKTRLEEKMLAQRHGRDTLCLALGGGVVGDMTGFIAATYLRGIPYVQLPTTLLAMVDSSVGGKTGIDSPNGKNLIGAFWQPASVIIDLNLLITLPKRQIICGLVEAFKVFLTCDANVFHHFNQQLDALLSIELNSIKSFIDRAIRLKAQLVTADERESHERMLLNFGHTIGHALEHLSHYRMLHGYAVGLGILVEAKIAELLGLLSADAFSVIRDLLERMAIRGRDLKPYSPQQIITATQNDKKSKAGIARYVLLKKIGQAFTKDQMFAHAVEKKTIIHAIKAVSAN